jgi:hypothetical protein
VAFWAEARGEPGAGERGGGPDGGADGQNPGWVAGDLRLNHHVVARIDAGRKRVVDRAENFRGDDEDKCENQAGEDAADAVEEGEDMNLLLGGRAAVSKWRSVGSKRSRCTKY